jgi:hypothetical protein
VFEKWCNGSTIDFGFYSTKIGSEIHPCIDRPGVYRRIEQVHKGSQQSGMQNGHQTCQGEISYDKRQNLPEIEI